MLSSIPRQQFYGAIFFAACSLALFGVVPAMRAASTTQTILGVDTKETSHLAIKSAADYNVHLPTYVVAYTEPQKEEQRQRTRALIRQINQGIQQGKTDFSFPPGVYRIPKEGPDNDLKIARDGNLYLKVAGCEFFLENGGNLLHYDDSDHECNISLIGPAKFDADPYLTTQGIITDYNAQKGLMTLQVQPDYPLSPNLEGVIESYSPQGVYLENSSWALYQDAKVMDNAQRLVQVKTAPNQPIYAAGNLVTLIPRQPVFLSLRGVRNLTVKDIDIYTGAGFMWGGNKVGGDWKFINVKGIPRPGTNRLRGVASCQVSVGGGDILFDNCSFSNSTDDLLDFGGLGIFMNVRQTSPRELLVWRGKAMVGDTINFYAHNDFLPIASAKIVSFEEVDDPALQQEARDVIKTINKGRLTDEKFALHRVTLDHDVTVAAGDFAENATSSGPNHLTVRHCFFSNSGVRAMFQGFQHGLFENNTFDRISGGLAMTVDAWWWGGPVVQDITIRNNVFTNTTFRNGWGTGHAAIAVGADNAPTRPARTGATHRVSITDNTITDSSQGAIFVGNATDVTVKDNVITGAKVLQGESAILLNGVYQGTVAGNTITNSGPKAISITNSSAVKTGRNSVGNSTIEIANSENCGN